MIKENSIGLAQDLVDFINASPSMYSAVADMERILKDNDFKELDLKKRLDIGDKDKYYIKIGSSSIVAFNIKSKDIEDKGFRIVGSHSDSPCFRIKANPEMKQGNVLKLNTEPYGGMIVSTWFDRPLSIAGRVFVKNNEDIFRPSEHIINFDQPLVIIPNLAIHMNRTINEGYAYNKQVDLIPMVLDDFAGGGELKKDFDKDYLLNLIKDHLENTCGLDYIAKEDILDYDLYLYEYEKGSLVGKNKDYISCGRLDNLASAHASIMALIDQEDGGYDGITMACVFNNEEVGSMSKEGADSSSLVNILERISIAMGKTKEEFLMALENSFMVSADLAHAVHPNKPEQADPTNGPVFGGGVAIKIHAGKAYASDAHSVSVFRTICDSQNIKNQYFMNRSDKRSGSTIGSIMSSHMSMPIVDVGIPILAMHSIRELANTEDYMDYYRAIYYFYSI